MVHCFSARMILFLTPLLSHNVGLQSEAGSSGVGVWNSARHVPKIQISAYSLVQIPLNSQASSLTPGLHLLHIQDYQLTPNPFNTLSVTVNLIASGLVQTHWPLRVPEGHANHQPHPMPLFVQHLPAIL